ncbi:MAG: MTH938/NDUFAF3 family protein [Candidatus Omnitrophica bacterium]|nr:MTH938/NDUFAF3 family protein [Candidatus Omnitrophota bacterium]
MKIEKYNFGEIVINGKNYKSDLIILNDRIIENWRRKEGHCLSFDDLKGILNKEIEIIIIGTGYSGFMEVPDKVLKDIEKLGINVIVEKTKDAVELFNEYVKKNKKVVFALHLTC